MKVLVATEETQGRRKSDFFWTNVGELVTFGYQCDGNDDLDGGCGCQRSMVGIETLKATTTFEVVERPALTRPLLYDELAGFYKRGGWDKVLDSKDLDAEIHQSIYGIEQVCAVFGVGTVLEKRGEEFVPRVKPGALRSG